MFHRCHHCHGRHYYQLGPTLSRTVGQQPVDLFNSPELLSGCKLSTFFVRRLQLSWCALPTPLPFLTRFSLDLCNFSPSLPTTNWSLPFLGPTHYWWSHPRQYYWVKNQPVNAGNIRDSGLIPGSARSPGEGNGNQLQYSCLKNPTDRGVLQVAVHRVPKSQTWDLACMPTHTHYWDVRPDILILVHPLDPTPYTTLMPLQSWPSAAPHLPLPHSFHLGSCFSLGCSWGTSMPTILKKGAHKKLRSRMDTCIRIAESLCCSPETITTLLINCIPTQMRKFK